MHLDRAQRDQLADVLKETAVGVLLGLVIGGLVEKTIPWAVAVFGVTIYLILATLSVWLKRTRR